MAGPSPMTLFDLARGGLSAQLVRMNAASSSLTRALVDTRMRAMTQRCAHHGSKDLHDAVKVLYVR